MSQWFNGVGPLTPTSPAHAASVILEGVVKEHEGNLLDHSLHEDSTKPDIDALSYRSAYPLFQETTGGTVCHLCFFPSGVHSNVFKCQELHRYQTISELGLIAFAFSSSRHESRDEPHFHLYENGSKLAGTKLQEKVACIAIESRDRVAIGHEGHVDIYDRQGKTFAVTERKTLTGHSPVVMKFSGEVLLVGTKHGGVCGLNMRKGQVSWTFQSEARGRIYDLHMKKGIVYVSGSGGLWMWDMRGTGKMRRQFLGHRNRGRKLKFDLNAEIGLVAAGGDDGAIRIWNCRSGEDPIGELQLPGEVPTAVKVVRATADGEETLGMWIATKRRLYICIVDVDDLY